MDRAQKEKVVEELGQIFESSGVVVVAHYAGLTVAEMQDLRARLRDAGGSVRVAKNKLAKIALEGKPNASLADLLTGMTVLSYSEDPVAAAKAAQAYAKDNKKFEILGGAMGRERARRRRCRGRIENAVARGTHLDDRRHDRCTRLEYRRGNWRACFEHREHPLDNRGEGRSGLRQRLNPRRG